MALLTTDEIREHVETALPDSALGRLLASAEQAVAGWAGPLGFDEDGAVLEVTDTLSAPGRPLLRLRQVPTAITSVTDATGTSETVLDASAYRVEDRYLRRLGGRAWGDRTTVTYTPFDDSATRRTVLIGLVALEVNFQPGMASQGAGPWSETYSRYLRQRDELLSVLPAADPPMARSVPFSSAIGMTP